MSANRAEAERAALERRFNVNQSGPSDAPAMVFAHGYATNQTVWRRVAGAFEDDYHVTLFDHLQGDRVTEPGSRDHASLYDYADDVVELLRGLGLERVVWVGHSVGGVIGALASARAPELFDRLVMVGPSARFLDDEGYVGGFSQAQIDDLLRALDQDFRGWAHSMAPVLVGEAGPDVAAELAALLTAAPQGPGAAVARHTLLADHRDDFQHVRVPALVMQASRDPLVPVEVGRFIEANLPDGHFVQLAATGHFPSLSAPAEVVAAIRAFL